MSRCPATSISVTMGDWALILQSLKTEQYSPAASLAWLLNQRQGVICFFMIVFFLVDKTQN
jgi:hypothetical protein